MDVIVQKFAQYFSSVFTIDDNVELPKVENLPCIYPFNELVVTEKMVLYQLKMLDISKSAGPDDINARMLKELAVVISKPLSMLFNNSLKMGTVPSEWKMAYIAPIHKKNDRKMVSNYRPISLTCITYKVMEKKYTNKLLIIFKSITIFLIPSMVSLRVDLQTHSFWK